MDFTALLSRLSKYKWGNALIAFVAVCGVGLWSEVSGTKWVQTHPIETSMIATGIGLFTKFYRQEKVQGTDFLSETEKK